MDLPGKSDYSSDVNKGTYSCTFGFSQTLTPSNMVGVGDRSVTEIIQGIKTHQTNPLNYNQWNEPADEIAASSYTYTIYEGTNSEGVVDVTYDRVEPGSLITSGNEDKTTTGSDQLNQFPTGSSDGLGGDPSGSRNPLG